MSLPSSLRQPRRRAFSFLLHLTLGASLLAAGMAASAQAPAPAGQAPGSPAARWSQPLGPTVADARSAHYRFEMLRFDSADGERHYRVYLGIPGRPAPAAGHPVIYMLDGNAAMATLTPEDLARLDEAGPPVLVGIGYEIDARHDVVARAYDYTPPVVRQGAPVPQVMERGRRGGGAQEFLNIVETRIRPAVEARVAIDRGRQTLWGHSYGGLFTLYTLLTHPQSFQRYVAGDPSVGWQDSAVLAHAENFHAKDAPGVTVRVLVGGAQRVRPGSAAPESPPQPTIPGVPPGRESTHALVTRLAEEGMDITFQSFPELSHGPMFAASLRPALEVAVQP